MNADFQLRHATVSRHGSFWGTQTDATTRGRLRNLSRVASSPSRLQRLDAGAAYALGASKMIQEDLVIEFQDGHFGMIGPDFEAFSATETDPGDYILSRDNTAPGLSSGETARRHSLWPITQGGFETLMADVPALGTHGTWFLIPKPSRVNPIVLATRIPGVDLVNGVDFFTSRNFIITQLPPAEYFTPGGIVASVAEVGLESFESHVSDTPRNKKGRKWGTTYARRSQSVELFRRAAAEFCGLYVLPTDDFLLSVFQLPDDTHYYAFAANGVVHVDYPHTPLVAGQSYGQGMVVCDKFEIRNAALNGSDFLTEIGVSVNLLGVVGYPLSMPADGLVGVTYTHVGAGGKPHVQLELTGEPEYLAKFWAMQRAQEQRTDLWLADSLGVTAVFLDANPTHTADFASYLRDFYGRRLHALVVDALPEEFQFELYRFVREHHPVDSVILLVERDGEPLPFEYNFETFEGIPYQFIP